MLNTNTSTDDKMQVILGSGGAIGNDLAKELKSFTGKIRLASRNPKKINDNDELVICDLTNLKDVDAAVNLILEFYNDIPTFAILKHNNACGLASRNSLLSAYKDALAGDPVSAFGGVLISNKSIDVDEAVQQYYPAKVVR